MTIFLLQARADLAADRVADGLSKWDLVRLALGVQPAPIRLTNVDVVVAWTAAAADLGWARFAALLGAPCAVTLIQLDGAALPPANGLSYTAYPWREGEPIRLELVHHAAAEQAQAGQRAEGQNSVAQMAAGAVAALGVIAAGAAQPMPINPVTISRRESSEKSDAGVTQAAQAEASQRAPVLEAHSAAHQMIIDLDALAGAALPTTASAAKALVEAMMKPAPIRPTSPEAPKRRASLMIPGVSTRPW